MKRFLLLLYCFWGTLYELRAQDKSEKEKSADKRKIESLSIAYASENFIRPGMQLAANFFPVQGKRSELMVSSVATIFVFRPFYTSLLLGGRALYQIHFTSGITLRPIGITPSYKYKFLSAPVYEVRNGNVVKDNSQGYGNFHLLATTGLAYNFSDKKGLPCSVFTDFGVSAEPYFGVYKFHYEIFIGVSYHLNYNSKK